MGWYGGAGARRVAGPIVRAGIAQADAAARPDHRPGGVPWRDPYRLRDRATPTDPGRAASTSRVDSPRARRAGSPTSCSSCATTTRRRALLFQSSVTTFAAYNNWGGKSLYAFNSGGARRRARSPSIGPTRRTPTACGSTAPATSCGAGSTTRVRFLEREGYDVTYTTDVDTHRARGPLPRGIASSSRSATTSTGRGRCATHVEAARDRGRPPRRSSAPTRATGRSASSRTRAATPDRTIVGYKEAGRRSRSARRLDGAAQNNRLDHRPLARRADRAAGGGA